jgi:hypothetical protein
MVANKTAISSGGGGDLVFSIPIFRAMGVHRVIVKESFYPPGFGSLYSSIKPLLENQGFAVDPCIDDGKAQFHNFPPDAKYDVNMDEWRACKMRGRWHIMASMANYWHLRGCTPRTPWLRTDGWKSRFHSFSQPYTIWSLTPRWRENAFDWKTAWWDHGRHKGYFVGFDSDWQEFRSLVGDDEVPHLHTPDFMELAVMIHGCTALYCNQGIALAIAQGIGKDHFCAYKSTKTNCRTYTKWDHSI